MGHIGVYNPLTTHVLTSWDIQSNEGLVKFKFFFSKLMAPKGNHGKLHFKPWDSFSLKDTRMNEHICGTCVFHRFHLRRPDVYFFLLVR